MEQKHGRKFRKFFEKNINFPSVELNFIFPYFLKQKSRNEKYIKEYLVNL